ncbi:hypothetical protein PHMEG_0008845 [Phytophthora megakarya]|uniref:Uncharacterized protein n=1 Tax=Phytophthora megakarya TaxID=4795 RepID=A0A225WK65_9STRA|nr:hypothetical protein PHMEG_0008845 [Phytophthora megakarya]
MKVTKNTKKDDRIKILVAWDTDKDTVEVSLRRYRKRAAGGRRWCGIRIMRMPHQRIAPDTGEFGAIISEDSVFEGFDVSFVMAHSVVKLKCMWNEVSSNFARAEAGSKISGQGSDVSGTSVMGVQMYSACIDGAETVMVDGNFAMPTSATPYDACPWKGKVLTCQGLNRVTIMETGTHETLVREPRKPPKFNAHLKDYERELATQGMMPARIRMGKGRRFGLAEDEMPTLREVQGFVCNFTKKKFHRNDAHDEVLSEIEELAYHPGVTDTQLFSFAWDRDARGKPDVGNNPASFVFHMDATFKLNQVAYPVIALKALCKMFAGVTQKQLLLKYVMADAEAAQQNAVEVDFGVDSEFMDLMFFYHVMAKVHEKLKGVADALHAHVVADIYGLHFEVKMFMTNNLELL